jgi:hypothetical protein
MPSRPFKFRASILATATLFVGLTLAEADAQRERVLPVSMVGVWGWSAQSCRTAGDDGRVNIQRNTVTFFASSYALRKILVRPDGALLAHAIVQEEGEPGSAEADIVLKHLRQNRLSIRTDAAGPHTYVRCR